MSFTVGVKFGARIGHQVYLNTKPCNKCQRLINKINHHPGIWQVSGFSTLFQPFPETEKKRLQTSLMRCGLSGFPPLPDKQEFIEKHEKLFKRRDYKHYILDKSMADQIANTIQKNRENKDSMLVLIDSGLGHIVQAFLENGANNIMCLENNKFFIPYLQEFQKYAPDKIHLITAETHLNLYLTSWLYLVSDVREFLQFVPTREWDDVPPLSMFIVLKYSRKNVYKFYNIIDKLVWKLSIYSVGRSEVFTVIDAAAYKSLNHKIDGKGNLTYNKSLPILYRTLFDVNTLLKIPAATFYSQLKVKKPVVHEKFMILGKEKLSNKFVYLLRIVPKKDLYTKVLTWENIHKFKEFLQLLLYSKYGRLIPTMERKIPGCGLHLIKMGFTMTIATGKLDEDDYLKIFKAMRQWPEYEGSPMEEVLERNPNHVFQEHVNQHENDD